MNLSSHILIISLSLFFVGNTSCKEDSDSSGPEDVQKEIVKETDSAYTETIQFKSLDDLMITADRYHLHKDSPVIVLCHQAGWSRGEYKEIAPKLNALGYNCLAIDQRSGNAVNNVTNETAERAQKAGKAQTYNDAKQDIEAAVRWASKEYDQNLVLWGSSYSSSLVLIVATEMEEVFSVLSFSPGEYLGAVGVKSSITGLNKPVFITSSKSEQFDAKSIYNAIPSAAKTQFIPTGKGEHGSRALWEEKTDHKEYWDAVKQFLN